MNEVSGSSMARHTSPNSSATERLIEGSHLMRNQTKPRTGDRDTIHQNLLIEKRKGNKRRACRHRNTETSGQTFRSTAKHLAIACSSVLSRDLQPFMLWADYVKKLRRFWDRHAIDLIDTKPD